MICFRNLQILGRKEMHVEFPGDQKLHLIFLPVQVAGKAVRWVELELGIELPSLNSGSLGFRQILCLGTTQKPIGHVFVHQTNYVRLKISAWIRNQGSAIHLCFFKKIISVSSLSIKNIH